MIVSYAVSNFLSILDEVEISFLKGEGNDCTEEIIQCKNEDLNLLKTAIMFGKNGSGKSNIIFSLGYVARLILSNPYVIMKEKDINRMDGPVNYKGNADEVSKFYFTFYFSGTSNIVSYELWYNSHKALIVREEISDSNGLTIIRDSDGKSSMKYENDSGFILINQVLSCNQSIISYNYENLINKHRSDCIPDDIALAIVLNIYDAMSNMIVISFESESVVIEELFPVRLDIIDYLEKVLSATTDVEKIMIEKFFDHGSDFHRKNIMFFRLMSEPVLVDNDSYYRILYKERGNDIFIPFEQLSTGIQRIIILLLVTSVYIDKGKIDNFVDTRFVVVDEMCYSLHPKLTRFLMDQISFGSSKYPQSTQSLYSMHDTNVLSMKRYRNDEFYLVDKKDECTVVQSVYDYDDVAGNIQSMYLEGRFGSIPTIGNIKGVYK